MISLLNKPDHNKHNPLCLSRFDSSCGRKPRFECFRFKRVSSSGGVSFLLLSFDGLVSLRKQRLEFKAAKLTNIKSARLGMFRHRIRSNSASLASGFAAASSCSAAACLGGHKLIAQQHAPDSKPL